MCNRGNTQTITDHLDHLRLRNARPATCKHRRTVLRSLAAALDGPLLGATRDQLETWQEGLTVSVSSRETYRYHVQAFYKWATTYEWIATDPSERLVTARRPQRLPRPIPEDALALALRCADQRMRAWLVLSAYAGLRAGEIARLRREHVQDMEHPALVYVIDGKGGKDRIVPIGARVVEALRPHLHNRGPLWRTQRGQQTSPNYVTQEISEYYQSLGLPYTCHSGRHRFATRIYQLSGDLRMTSALLGHSNPATTAQYTAWSPTVAADAVMALDKRLAA